MKCCVCGPVKNCGPYLDRVFLNIEKIGALFEDYVIILFYDHSTDDTLFKIKSYQRKNQRLSYYANGSKTRSPYRTHRIAHARNYCIDQIREKYSSYPFFIMMDFDDPNSVRCRPEIIQKYLKRDDWDALSFNTAPAYYDIWALSLYPFCFSYNHFRNNNAYYRIIQKYVTNRLNALATKDANGCMGLLQCISSFNGFSIYKTEKFIDCKYDGRINVNLLPQSYMKAHSMAARSPVIYKDYGHVKGRYEDCEHRAFHVQAIRERGARIMISPEVVFTGKIETL